MEKLKSLFAILFIIGLFFIGFYFLYINTHTFINKGKKAVINGSDTCTVISEDRDSFFRVHSKKIKVIYKDSDGKYNEQLFDYELVKIIDEN